MAGMKGLHGFENCGLCYRLCPCGLLALPQRALRRCWRTCMQSGVLPRHARAAQHDGVAAGMAHLREAALRGWCVPCGLPGCWHAGICFSSRQHVARIVVFCSAGLGLCLQAFQYKQELCRSRNSRNQGPCPTANVTVPLVAHLNTSCSTRQPVTVFPKYKAIQCTSARTQFHTLLFMRFGHIAHPAPMHTRQGTC